MTQTQIDNSRIGPDKNFALNNQLDAISEIWNIIVIGKKQHTFVYKS